MTPYGDVPPMLWRLETAAEKLGRLRRRLAAIICDHCGEQVNAGQGVYNLFLLDGIGDELESLDMQLRPTAGEELALRYPDPSDENVEFELAVVDAARDRFRQLLGRETR